MKTNDFASNCLILSFLFFFLNFSSQSQATWDVYADTWVGFDGLGRETPTSKEVGNVKKNQNRFTGMFYVSWHGDKFHNIPYPGFYNLSQIIDNTGEGLHKFESTMMSHLGSQFHWGEPEMGYFLSKDKYVIQHDLSMLADAGIDVIVLDVTNGVTYWEEWDVLFSVMEDMKKNGNKVPKFCFWTYNGMVITIVQELYDRIYKNSMHKDLWFQFKGKPLLLYKANPNFEGIKNKNLYYQKQDNTLTKKETNSNLEFLTDYPEYIKQFFTLRNMWWGYYEWQGKRFVGTENNWSFGYAFDETIVKNLPADKLVSRYKGLKEEMAVTPAGHASLGIGKSWTKKYGEPPLNKYDLPENAYLSKLGKKVNKPYDYGIFFQDRWDEALKVDPEFLYINDWNEWTARPIVQGESSDFMNRKSPFVFIDQYNLEFNRTLQPMKDGYKDNYYLQLVNNIRRYKGTRSIPQYSDYFTAKIDGSFNEWKLINQYFRDTKGDTVHRDYDGYYGLHYKSELGRNDILETKITNDKDNLYFYVRTVDNITNFSDNNSMYLFIDVDNNNKTGWNGYDILINKDVKFKGITSVHIFNSKSNIWVEVATTNFAVTGKEMELLLPKSIVNLVSKDDFVIDFKWVDNPKDIDDAVSLSLSGDTAPNRNFNYRYIFKK